MGADFLNRLKVFWAARNPRERRVLLAGSVTLAVAVLYGALYVPIEMAYGKLAERLPRLRAEHRLLMAQVEEIRNRRPVPMPAVQESEMRRRVEVAARAAGLGDGDFHVTAEGGDRVRFAASSSAVGTWLEMAADLQRQGIRIQAARLNMTGKEGLARIEATLTMGPP